MPNIKLEAINEIYTLMMPFMPHLTWLKSVKGKFSLPATSKVLTFTYTYRHRLFTGSLF